MVATIAVVATPAEARGARITLQPVGTQYVDATFSLVGRISGTGARNDKRVILQRLKGDRWVRVARLLWLDDGPYAFGLRSYVTPGTRTFRTVVKRDGRILDVSPTRAVAVQEWTTPTPTASPTPTPPPTRAPTPTPTPTPTPDPPTGASTIVSLTFDDTLANQATAVSVLQEHGMRATLYVNSTRIGAPNYLSEGQLDAYAAAGHEIGGHTLTHADLTAVSADEARRQVCDDRVELLARGYAVTSFANPYGATDTDVQQIISACGYNSARGVSGLRSPGYGCASCPTAESVPPVNVWRIRTPASVHSTTTLQMLQDYVTRAESDGGGWVPLTFHGVCAGCASNAIDPGVFRAFVDWLGTRPSTTQVRTVHEVIGGSVRPGVPYASP